MEVICLVGLSSTKSVGAATPWISFIIIMCYLDTCSRGLINSMVGTAGISVIWLWFVSSRWAFGMYPILTTSTTGGEGQYTWWVHCELIVGFETIHLTNTQQVSGGHFQKVPSTKPSGYFVDTLPKNKGGSFQKYPLGFVLGTF